MQITNAAARIAARLEAKRARRPWNADLHPRDSKGRFIETGGIARLWGGGTARVLRALGGRNVLVENLTTHERSTVHASRLTMVARPDGTAPTKSKKKVRDEDERRGADGRRGTGQDAEDGGDQGDTPDDPHGQDDEGNDIGQDVDGEDLGAGPEPDDDEPDEEPQPAQKRARRDPKRRFKTLEDVRAHWASGKLRPFTEDRKAQESHNQFMAGLLDQLEKPQLSRNGHFVIGQMKVRRNGQEYTGWGIMHTETGVRLSLPERKAEALDFANRLENAELDGEPIDWNDPDSFGRLATPEGRAMGARLAEESRQAFARRAAKKREGATARTKPAAPASPEQQAAQQVADRTGVPAANVAVGHVGPQQPTGDERGRPRNDAELREFWKRGGSDETPAAQRDSMRELANDPNVVLHLADHRGFAIVEDRRDGRSRFQLRAVGTARPLVGLGNEEGDNHRYGEFEDRETANRFALHLGSNLRDQDGRTVDWGAPRLNRGLIQFRDKDGQRSGAAIWQIAGEFDRQRGVSDSPAARLGRRPSPSREDEQHQGVPETPDTTVPGDDVTPQQAAGQQRNEQEEQGERVHGAGEGVLGDVPAGGPGRAGGDDPAGDVLRADQRGDRGADRGLQGGLPGEDGAGSGLPGRDREREHGDDAGAGEGPARDGVQPGEGDGHRGSGDAEGQPAADRSRVAFGSREEEQRAPQYQPPEDGRSLVPNGVLPRVKANIAAIEVLRRLEDENRPATAAEQDTLARWSGWGATPQVFVDDPKPEFKPLQDRLRELLSESEWDAAKENTLNAHYTDPAIAQQVWKAVRELGFDGGNVLEPGSGSGNFIGHAPADAHLTGVELDPITAGISKALYPNADIRNEGFERTRAADGTFDMTVGNVPFGDYQVVDLRHNKGGHNIHNHFILKSLDLTRPGGLVAVVTSRYTMDNATPRGEDARMEMARKADLVGAIRLPTGAHRRTAGTDVVTDLLIFRRRERDKDFTSGRQRSGAIKTADQRKKDDPPMWVHSVRVEDLPGQEVDEDTDPRTMPKVHVNPYFLDNPRNVLGEMAVGHGMYGPGELRVDGDGPLEDSLAGALERVVARAKDSGLSYTPDTGERRKVEMLPEGSTRTDGHVQVSPDGTFTQVRDGMVVPFEVPRTQVEEATQLLGLRDAMKALVAEESRADADDALIETLRGDLKARYEKYHAKFGSLNRFDWATRKGTDPTTGKEVEKAYRKRPPMGSLLTKDPTMAVVLSLDSYDDHTGTSTPAAIFAKRQSRHRTIADRASNPEDAMAIVMEQRGTLDTETLSKVMGVSPQVARERLLAARSVHPETGHEYPLVFEPHNGGDLIPAADYLSGNVRQKLEEAQALAGEDARYDINVKQLEAVLPPDISPGEIDAPMGAAWLGGETVQSFLRERLNSNAVRVSYQGGSLWKVDAPDGVKRSSAATDVWGTGDFNAIKLAETILTNGRIRVTYQGDDGKTYVDEEATAAAQTKAEEMREEFQDWLWASPERAERIKKLYNDTHNNLALRSYDGQRRTMPGLAEWFKPHAHQHAAVARMVNEPAVLLAHEVGAGKTAEMTMGVMELRRLGLINKAAMVVPNHMLQQFHDEFAELYPESAANGRILAASSEDLQGRKRREFIARVATGDYDAVILTQNAFESIPMRPEVQLEYIKREKKHLEEALRRQKEQDALEDPSKRRDSRMVKEIQNRLKKLEAKITAKVESSKDMAGLYFEDTGIDYVVVDEAHHYKNLATNSGIPGAAIEGSNRASDLDMKLEYLRKNTKSGRVVTFATATPISNSVTEAHTMLRYLRPDLLEAARVLNFDEFASTYGKIVNGIELAADGSGFKEVSRFAAFRNMPELLRIWRTVADVKTSEDLAEYLDTPDVASGKAITVSVEPTEQMLAYQRELAARARAVKRGEVEPTEDNMLKISSDGRKVSLDPRMVGLDEQGNKLPKAADNIARIYEETKDAVYPTSKNNPTPHDTPGGLQIVFLDMGTPQDPGKKKGKKGDTGPTSVEELSASRFPAYQELKDLLIERGVPAEKIRFIHEAKNDAEKARLFNDARTGKIAVLLGSTSKMGTGTNVQLRATALHHLDCPWRPADLEQRNGRIIRQGNFNPEVAIFQYVTEQSFDGFSWQTVARKAKFIRQIMKGNLTDRTVEDIPDGVFNAEQVTAISTGNPYLLEQANVKASLAVLKRKLKGHQRTIEGYKSTILSAERMRQETDKLVAQLQDVIGRRKNTRGDDFNATIGNNDFTKRAEAAKALSTAAQAVLRQGQQNPYRAGGHPKVVIGRVGNIEVTAQYRTAWGDFGRVHLVDISIPDIPRSRHSYTEEDIKKDSTLPITRLEDSLADVDKMIVRAESRLRQEERAADTARERVDRPFEQGAELEAAERRAKLVGALIKEQSRETSSPDAQREKHARLEALEHQLREARLAAGEDSADVDDPAAAQDTDLLPRTPAAPSISTDEKGRPRIVWPDAEAKKAAKEREKREKAQRAREERGETTLDPEEVRNELGSLREASPAEDDDGQEQREEDSTEADTGASAGESAPDGEPDDSVRLDAEQVRSELDALGEEAAESDKTSDSPEPDANEESPEDRSDDGASVEEPAGVPEDTEDSEPDNGEQQEPEEEPAEESTGPGVDFPADGEQVITPDGPGEVVAVNDDGAVLVRGEQSTRVHALKDVTRPDGTPFGKEQGQEAEKARENAEQIAKAATPEGVELSTGHRLRDLDMEAGHGTIVDQNGRTVGWVRARTGDDGRRWWWGQDADGGAPADMQWHEEMAAQAGAAPLRAASIVRDGLDFIRQKYTGRYDENGRPEQERRRPVTPDRAITEMTLTPAQVRELGKLTLSGQYADGTPIDTLPWNPGHRRYSPYSAQAGALAAAAREAAAEMDQSTPEGRRNRSVLLGAARKMEFQEYDSARRAGSIPPPGQPDEYDKPYEPRAEDDETTEPGSASEPEGTPEPADESPTTPAPATAAEDPADGAEGGQSAPEDVDDSEVLDPDQVSEGDYVRVETQNTAGNAVVREGFLLAAPKQVTASRDRQRIKAWRLYVGKEGEQPTPRNAVTILLDEKVERLPAPSPDLSADKQEEDEQHTNTLGWKGPEEQREQVGEHDGKPLEVGELHVRGNQVERVVYLDGEPIGRLHGANGAWGAISSGGGRIGNGWFSAYGHRENPTRAAALAIANAHQSGNRSPLRTEYSDPQIPQEQAERALASHLDPNLRARWSVTDHRGEAGVYVDDNWAGGIKANGKQWQVIGEDGKPGGTLYPTREAAAQAVAKDSPLLNVTPNPSFHFPQHPREVSETRLDQWIAESERWLAEDAPSLPDTARTPHWVRKNLEELKKHREQREAGRARDAESLGGEERINALVARATLEPTDRSQPQADGEEFRVLVDGEDAGEVHQFGGFWQASANGRHGTDFYDRNQAVAFLVTSHDEQANDGGTSSDRDGDSEQNEAVPAPGPEATGEDEAPPLSFPNDRAGRADAIREWAGVWAEPQPAGVRNVYLDRALAEHSEGWVTTTDPWGVRQWISTMADIEPLAQYDENARRMLEEAPEEARQFLSDMADELRASVRQMGEELRADIRPVLVDHIATRNGRKRAIELRNRMAEERVQKVREAVRAQIARARASASEHGLSEQQAEDFIVGVTGGDNPGQKTYGIRGEFPEAIRPLNAAMSDAAGYWSAFAGWATQDDSNNWAGMHWANIRRESVGAPMSPSADARTGTGEMEIGTAELPKGMRWARGSELRDGDIFHTLRHPKDDDVFNGMEPPQYVIHTHRDGREGEVRSVTLDSDRGGNTVARDQWVVLVENPEPAVRKRAQHRARTDVFTNWELPKDDQAYELGGPERVKDLVARAEVTADDDDKPGLNREWTVRVDGVVVGRIDNTNKDRVLEYVSVTPDGERRVWHGKDLATAGLVVAHDKASGRDEQDDEPEDSGHDPEGEQSQDDAQSEGGNRSRRRSDRDGAAPDEAGGSGGDGGTPSPDVEGGDDEGRDRETDGVGEDADNEDQDEQESEREDDRRSRRRRRRDRERERPESGGPGAGLPGVPHVPNQRDRDDRGNDDEDRAGDFGDGRLKGLKERYRSGKAPAPRGADPQRHAEYLRGLAGNDSLTLSPGGSLVTWTNTDDNGTWRFGHAASGLHLEGWEVNGAAIGGREGARRLAGAYEQMLAADGDGIDVAAPVLDPVQMRAWRDAEGRPLTDALARVRQEMIDQHQDGSRPSEPRGSRDSADEHATETGVGRSADAGDERAADPGEPDRMDRAGSAGTTVGADGDSGSGDQGDQSGRADTASGEASQGLRPVDDEEQHRKYAFWLRQRISHARVVLGDEPLLSPEAEADGISVEEVFSDASLTADDGWQRYASDALKQFFTYAPGRRDFDQWSAGGEGGEHGGGALATNTPQDGYDPTTPRFRNLDALREHIRGLRFDPYGPHDEPSWWAAARAMGQPWKEIVNSDKLFLSPGKRLVVLHNPESTSNTWQVRAPGSMRRLINEGLGQHGSGEGFSSKKAAMRAAVALEGVRDSDGNPFPWDAPDVVQRAAEFRDTEGRSLSEAMAVALAEHPPYPQYAGRYQQRAEQIGREIGLRRDAEQQAHAEGYSVAVRPGTGPLKAGDEVLVVGSSPGDDRSSNPKSKGIIRGRLAEDAQETIQRGGVAALGSDTRRRLVIEDGEWTGPDGTTMPFSGTAFVSAPDASYRKPRPAEGDLADGEADDESGGTAADAASDRPTPAADAGAVARPTQSGELAGQGQRTAAPRRPRDGQASEPGRDSDEPETPAAPEPVGGRPAEWVKVGDLGVGDLVRIEGITKTGTPRTLAGYVVDGPREVSTVRARRVQGMYRAVIAENPDGRGERGSVWVLPDATAARATRDDADQVDGAPQSGADSDVLTGRISGRVPTDRAGRGLFPGSVVTDDDGREGVVTGATASNARVQFGDDRSDDTHAPTSLTVTDGGAARPSGWTPDGNRVRTGSVVGDRNGAMLGTVEDVDGDTATVATPQGMEELPAADLRVIGDVEEPATQQAKVGRLERVPASDLTPGRDSILVDGPDGMTAAQVTGKEEVSETHTRITAVDTTTGELHSLDGGPNATYTRLLTDEGEPAELDAADAPDNAGEITSHEPLPSVDPVAEPTVEPELSPEERDAIADRGEAPTDSPEAQQAAARIANDLPVTPAQASALADDLREGADSSTPEGRAALRAADHLDGAAGNDVDEVGRPEPGTVGTIGVGDTITLPGEFDSSTMTAFRVVQIQDAPGGIRVLTIEDEDGMRFKRALPAGEPLYQLPEPDAPAADPDAEPRDPNPTPDADKLRSDYADDVVRAVIDSAVQGTTTPGSIHQLREQIAQQLTPESLRAAMRRARNGALAAITNAGIEGDERDELVRSLRQEASRARMDAIRAALRTVDDLEPLDGEAEEDTARRAADLLRLIPEALRNRPDGTEPAADGSHVDHAVAQHTDDAVREALQAAADGGPLTEERRAAIVAQLAERMAAAREGTARRIAAGVPEGRRPGVIAHILAGLVMLARKVIALVAAFLKALARMWQRSREGLRRMRERIARFRRSLMQRIRSWPETRRLRRLAAAADLPEQADGLPLSDRIAHWARLLPAPGRFGQVSRRARWYRPTNRSSLAAGQLPPVQDGVRWTMDRAVDGGPGPQALRHLAAVRAAGQDVDTDVVTRLSAAAPELGDDPHGTVRHASTYAADAERRLRDLEAAAAGGAPDADLEIAAARVEAQAARQEAARLRQAYTAALPGAVRDSLAEVREMGPGTSATLVTTPDSSPDAVRALTGVAQFVPRDWLSPTEARFIAARDGDAGAYDPESRTATVADLGDGGQGTAAYALLAHLQQHYPDLLAAQEAFHFTRTHTGRTGARRRTSLDRLLARLFRGRAGQGDTGGIVPMGLSTLFSGDWYEDDDLRAFLLGLLATR
ncbi:hypothetical protein EF903_01590 [Streptomyces sp. WAC05292]|uniref:helicase-related protein n=1 Tax=Streptomyces sp. WAC05292 TaxID=2487418 RepID=UPI000F745EE1|nr:helicase-related protein [Streptomyces sp. WAC05292]RSS97241.1 hypothetical protein EF903_01590 [Streptomyces sp. WAC05292]